MSPASYRFPEVNHTGGKKASDAHAISYGPEASDAYHLVRERFLPHAIDENLLLSGAVQLLAQGEFDLAADWIEDLAAYLDRIDPAMDAAGFAPDHHWRRMAGWSGKQYRWAAGALRATLEEDVVEYWRGATYGPMTNPAVRREVVELVSRVDAEQQPYFLGAYSGEGVALQVPGVAGRGRYCLPTRKAHAVARLLQEHPEMLVDRPAAPMKAKAPRRAARPRRAAALPQLSPVWIRNTRGQILAGGMPLFPEFMEAR